MQLSRRELFRLVGGASALWAIGCGGTTAHGDAVFSADELTALRAFADSLRAEESALRVTSVHPGRIDTAMQRQLVAFEGGDYDESKLLKPETVAKMVADVIATPADAHVNQIIMRHRG